YFIHYFPDLFFSKLIKRLVVAKRDIRRHVECYAVQIKYNGINFFNHASRYPLTHPTRYVTIAMGPRSTIMPIFFIVPRLPAMESIAVLVKNNMATAQPTRNHIAE